MRGNGEAAEAAEILKGLCVLRGLCVRPSFYSS
jgi:hypothetical protein